MSYYVNIDEVSQARDHVFINVRHNLFQTKRILAFCMSYYVKIDEMSQAWDHVLINVRHNLFQTKRRLVQMVDQNGGKFERV